jgi:hypothetical protein
MAQWRKKQTEGYGDIKFIIEPVEGLGDPEIAVTAARVVLLEVAVGGSG